MTEKTILCFGDSNTWGCDPRGGPRFDRATRWPGVLQRELGDAYHVVEEGLGGRTTVWDDPVEGDKSGIKHLYPLLYSHAPLDLLIILLGTNDLKNRFGVSAFDIGNSLCRLAKLARNCPDAFVGENPEILVICPPPLVNMSESPIRDMLIGGEEKSHQLAEAVRGCCEAKGVRMFNAGDVIRSSPADGIHWEAEEHGKLAKAVAAEVRGIL